MDLLNREEIVPAMKELLDYRSTAAFLNISVRTLKSLVKHGEIPCVRFSKKIVRFDRDDLAEWVRAHVVPMRPLPLLKHKPVYKRSATENLDQISQGLLRHKIQLEKYNLKKKNQ